MKKTITKISAFALIFLFSCQSAISQPNPVVSKKYADTEIENLISAYKMNRSQDIVPSDVLRQKLAQDFSQAKNIDWETAANIYEAEFKIGRTDYKALYNQDGNLLMYKVDIKLSELPAIVKNAAAAKYPKYKFDDLDKIVKGTNTTYKVEMEKGDTDIKALFGADGRFIKEIID